MGISIKKFNESVSFAEQPAESDLKEWAEAGFRTVVNLRPAAEVERGLSPSKEESLCGELGLDYFHLPTNLDDLSKDHVQQCREKLKGAPEPMVIHCAGGARAAVVASVIHAWEKGTSGEEAVGMVEQTGQSLNQKLRERVVELADSK